MPITVQSVPNTGATFTAQDKSIEVFPTRDGATYTSPSLHPNDISGLLAFYEAGSALGPGVELPADGTTLSTLYDLSGNGRHLTQATDSSRPLIRTFNRNLLTYNRATINVDATGWGNNVNCTVGRVTSPVSSGTGSLSMTAQALGAMSAYPLGNIGTSGVPITPSSTYTAQAKFRAATTGRSCMVQIRTYNAAGTGVQTVSGNSVTDSTGAWSTSTVTISTGSTEVYAAVYLHVTSASTALGEVHYADDIGLWQGASTTWVPPVILSPVGGPAIQFDNSGFPYLQNASAGMPTTKPFTVYAVHCDQETTSGDPYLFQWSGGSSFTFSKGATTGRAYVYAGTDWADEPAVTRTVPHVTSAIMNNGPTTSPIYGNGTLGENLNIGTNTPGTGILMGATTSAISMIVYSVLVYSGAHSTQTRQAIERSLGSQYGITVA